MSLPVDLMALDPPAIRTTGLRHVERAAGIDFRWLTGPRAELSFTCAAAARVVLVLDASSPLEGQSVAVGVNGRQVALLGPMPKSERLRGFAVSRVVLDLPPGQATVSLDFSRHNHRTPEDTFAPGDKDKLALIVRELRLEPAGS